MAKVIAVLYPDPVDGHPKKYARDDLPKITKYPDGQTAPTPSAIDFKPGELLGSVSGELGLRKFYTPEPASFPLLITGLGLLAWRERSCAPLAIAWTVKSSLLPTSRAATLMMRTGLRGHCR
jgi:hypothetical protein